jgi:hypothetical protein
MNFRFKKEAFFNILFSILLYSIGCNPPPPTQSPANEPEQEEQPQPSPVDDRTITDTGSVQNDQLDNSLIDSARLELEALELENRKLKLAAINERQRLRKLKSIESSDYINPTSAEGKPTVVVNPKAPVVEVSYSKTLDLMLLDQKIIWRAVGPGGYNISVTRVADNALVYNSSVEDTILPYASLELDESVRYALKVQHSTNKVSEKKSFSLIAKGTALNPTCK